MPFPGMRSFGRHRHLAISNRLWSLQDRENDKVSLAVDSGLWWATNVQGAGPHGLESINPVELNFLGPGRLRQHHGRHESSAAVTILTGIL